MSAVQDLQSKTTAMSICVSMLVLLLILVVLGNKYFLFIVNTFNFVLITNTVYSSSDLQTSDLAHYFTEHMCFLGCTKYPTENCYKKHLSTHGGRSNASTSMHHTIYKFDVMANHAEMAIDIFAQFFVEPTFTKSDMSREVNGRILL